ncbi:hypothetical protein PMAYCL1PPCAC_20138, partial [Pristionchus mayeri]
RVAVRRVHTIGHSAPVQIKEQLAKLPSGLIVASAEHLRRPPRSDQAHLMLTYRAGTRYETREQQGLVCLIKGIIYAGWKNTDNELNHATAASESYFSTFLTTDYFGIRISVPRHLAQPAFKLLGSFGSFKDWNNLPMLSTNDSQRPPVYPLPVDGVRSVAFGNSVSLSHSTRSKVYTARMKYTDALIRHFAST